MTQRHCNFVSENFAMNRNVNICVRLRMNHSWMKSHKLWFIRILGMKILCFVSLFWKKRCLCDSCLFHIQKIAATKYLIVCTQLPINIIITTILSTTLLSMFDDVIKISQFSYIIYFRYPNRRCGIINSILAAAAAAAAPPPTI